MEVLEVLGFELDWAVKVLVVFERWRWVCLFFSDKVSHGKS